MRSIAMQALPRRAGPHRPFCFSILTTSGRITKLRLVRPGSLVSNKIVFFPPEAAYINRFKSRGLVHEDRDRILRSMRL
jgi:hypothetical protein